MLNSPIIILGGNGMLGQYLAKTLIDLKPLVWDRNQLDITDPMAVAEKLTNVQPQIVINAAAYNDVDNAETEEGYKLSCRINAEAPHYLAEVCQKIDSVLVHYSTDYVFAGTARTGYKETAKPHPQNKYGKSKYLGEKKVLESKAQAYVIRTSRLFGKSGKGEMAKKNFVDSMLELAKTKKSIEVVDAEYSSPTYTKDLADTTRLILENRSTYQPGIYHISNKGDCTWYELVQYLFNQLGIQTELTPITAELFSRPAVRPEFSMLLNTKLPPLRSWRESLKEYLAEK